MRFRRGHNDTGSPGARKKIRYIAKDKGFSSPCWIWQLKIDKGGYGREGNNVAHRNYYERYVGPIPEGYEVDHKCGQRACVNPEHLDAVTKRQNLWRMFMRQAGLDYVQIESLREWTVDHLSLVQQEQLWSENVEG